ncbi:hypothetical protein ACEQ8H_003673 [Pleosporales sp. CAS-2024a]
MIHGSDPRFPYFLPWACRVNEATRQDIGLWFVRNTSLSILYPQHIVYVGQFLATFAHNQGFAAVRRLDFPLFARHRPSPGRANAYVDFAKRCPWLTRLRIKFEMRYLLNLGPGRRCMTTTTHRADDALLVDHHLPTLFALDALFDLDKVVSLIIDVWPKALARTSRGIQFVGLDCCWPAMERLGDWIRHGFQARGRKVDVRLEASAS